MSSTETRRADYESAMARHGYDYAKAGIIHRDVVDTAHTEAVEIAVELAHTEALLLNPRGTVRYIVEQFTASTRDGGGIKYAVIDTTLTAALGRVTHSRARYYVTRDQATAYQWRAELESLHLAQVERAHAEALRIEQGWCSASVRIPGLPLLDGVLICGADCVPGTDRCADHRPVLADVVLIERD